MVKETRSSATPSSVRLCRCAVRSCFSVEQRAYPIGMPARGIKDSAWSAPSFVAGPTVGAVVSVIAIPPVLRRDADAITRPLWTKPRPRVLRRWTCLVSIQDGRPKITQRPPCGGAGGISETNNAQRTSSGTQGVSNGDRTGTVCADAAASVVGDVALVAWLRA